jgi:SpoIID/LytB domain protein
MKPPPVKVALQIYSGPIFIHSRAPVTVETAGGFRKSLAPGEIRVSIEKVTIPETEVWLWCGVVRWKSSAQEWADKAANANLKAKISPIGLNPASGGWAPRCFRLLVRADKPQEILGNMLTEAGLLYPRGEFDELILPRGRPTFELLFQDDAGVLFRVTEPAQILSGETLKLIGAPVGEGFHWQHRENLLLPPPLWIDVATTGEICCGTEVALENYLMSVNSSEMPADSPEEFLKAQVIAARSWLLANWGSHHPGEPFTVCNGDHCQCYYGESRIQSSSRLAAEETRGELLMYEGIVCDARYAKTCGGVTEPGKNVWRFVDEPYLTHIRDLPDTPPVDLGGEVAFRAFQATADPRDACCAPGYAPLTGKSAELTELYRWEEIVSADELAEIIRGKTREDIGIPLSLTPIRRGPSGRIIELMVIGEKDSLRLSSELEIRRTLSRTHLPSSAFWVEFDDERRFILHGMGWGHGAGMCQMGAAGLAARGWNYRRILTFYYPSTSIQKIY